MAASEPGKYRCRFFWRNLFINPLFVNQNCACNSLSRLSVCSIHKAAAAAAARQHEVVRRPELLEEKDPRGRQAFLDVVMHLVCDTQRDYRLQISIKELSEHLLANVDALAAANIYRKVL